MFKKFIIPTSVLITISYWFYLASVAQIVIAADSIGYEYSAQIILDKGFYYYLQIGPNREPFYPLLISFSMIIAEQWNLPYLTIQNFIQVLFLILTQFLLLRIMKKANLHEAIVALTLLIFGFSHTIINTTFCLFSEIATLPLALGIVLASSTCWRNIFEKDRLKVSQSAIIVGLLFLIIMFIKGIFDIIIYLYVLPFIILLAYSFIKKDKHITINCLITLIIILSVMKIPVNTYKLANYRANGNYTFTDRGPWALYGNIARRDEQLNIKTILSGIVTATGGEYCSPLFSQETCAYWSYHYSDQLAFQKRNELEALTSSSMEVDKAFMKEVRHMIFSNPIKHGVHMAIESLRMFFWESTATGFTAYPDWLEQIQKHPLLKPGLNFLMGGISLISFVILLVLSIFKSKSLFKPHSLSTKDLLIIFSVWFAICYITPYSLFSIMIRYSLPIVPLYLFMIAVLMNHLFGTRIAGHQKD